MTHITRDLFDIAQRLKRINPRYEVFWNNALVRYEVHTSTKPTGMTLAFIPPHKPLDARTVDYALRTRIQNADYLEQEIQRNNASLEEVARKEFMARERDLEDMLAYANRTGGTVMFAKSKIKEF